MQERSQPAAIGVLPEGVLDRVCDRFRMLGDPTRLTIVNALHATDELSVGEIVEQVDVSYSTVSKHLALLRSHGLVARRRSGTTVYYRIDDPSLTELCDAVCKGVREDWARWGAALEQDLQR